jgi:hypothetical protein
MTDDMPASISLDISGSDSTAARVFDHHDVTLNHWHSIMVFARSSDIFYFMCY